MLHHGEFQHFPHLGQVFQTLLYGQLLHGVHHDLLGYFLVFSQLHREHVLQGEPVERGTGSVFEERGRKLNALELAFSRIPITEIENSPLQRLYLFLCHIL